jgi:hypothetical protein
VPSTIRFVERNETSEVFVVDAIICFTELGEQKKDFLKLEFNLKKK